jgi:hypothetical protein
LAPGMHSSCFFVFVSHVPLVPLVGLLHVVPTQRQVRGLAPRIVQRRTYPPAGGVQGQRAAYCRAVGKAVNPLNVPYFNMLEQRVPRPCDGW